MLSEAAIGSVAVAEAGESTAHLPSRTPVSLL